MARGSLAGPCWGGNGGGVARGSLAGPCWGVMEVVWLEEV